MAVFEFINYESLKKIIMIDANNSEITTEPEEYARYNLHGYYLAINTWLLLVDERAPISRAELQQIISAHGFFYAIKVCEEFSYQLINGTALSPFVRELISETDGTPESQKYIFQVLRFPKRFTPLKVDSINQASLQKFIAIENRNKLLSRHETNRLIVKLMADELRPILSRIRIDYTDCGFSNGVCADAKTRGEKVVRVATSDIPECHLRKDHSYPCVPRTSVWDTYPRHASRTLCPENFPGTYCERHNTAIGSAVPKTYKASRIIAPEEADRAYVNMAIYKALLRKMKKSKFWDQFCIEDQEKNRSFCRLASINNEYATLDWTSASDTVRKVVMRDVFPKDYLKLVEKYMPNHIIINGKEYTMQMASTAGCVLTFAHETLIFWALCRAAKRYYELFTSEHIGDVSVYGDDCIVPSVLVPLVMEFAEQLGLIMNVDKSYFGNDFYRETCGVEYFHGIDVASKYWPRKALQFDGSPSKVQGGPHTDLSIVSLIDLQHRLFDCKKASHFLSDWIRSVYPKMTASDPAENLEDLWSLFPISGRKMPPFDRKRAGKDFIVPDSCMRECHYYSTTEYNNTKVDSLSCQIYDHYNYYQFLLVGPMYEDPLMELLGISMNPNISNGFSKPVTRLRLG